jgi:hypothetical protein
VYLGLTDRLRSRTRSREHLLRLAQQLIAKLAWGATKTSRDALVRPSNLAVVDLAPWCTMCDKSRDFTKLANAVGLRQVSRHRRLSLRRFTLMRASTEGHIVRKKSSYALPDRYGDSYNG